MKKTVSILVISIVFVCALAIRPACATTEENSDANALKELIDILGEKGVVNQSEHENLRRKITTKETISHLISDRITWSGDLRLRYQSDSFDEENEVFLNPSNPAQIMNTRANRQRVRLRFRLGVTARVTEGIEVAARITTGNEKDPVSTNETLGDYGNKDSVVFDQIYLKWGFFNKSLLLWGGKIPNPFFYSDLVWDDDLTPEGAALQFTAPWSSPLKAFVNLGYFIIQEAETDHDKKLYGYQLGMEFKQTRGISFTLGAAYYDYQNIFGKRNDPAFPGEEDYTAPLYQQKGNTLMDIDPGSGLKLAIASDYNELDFTGKLDFGFFDPVHIVLLANFVRNEGFDSQEVSERTGDPELRKQIDGYQIGLSAGHLKVYSWGEWRVSCFYKYLESDAVIDAFTDSDFHLGGTNCEGVVLSGDLGIKDNLWLSLKWLSSNEIDGPPLAIDILQLNINARF